MTITRRTLVKGIATTGLTATFAGYASAAGEAQYVARGQNAAAAAEDAGFTVRNELAGGRVVVVTGPGDAVEDLRGRSGIAQAVRDVRVELPEPVAEATEDEADASNGREGDGEAAEAALSPVYEQYQWDKQVQGLAEAHERATGAGTRLGIIDTGVDHTHPDLGNVNTDLSVSIVGGEISDHAGDSSDHGTHVAGIAAATGERRAIGTAPDAEIVSIRVFGEDGGAAFSDILLAIEYAADNGVDAANMSIGTDPIPPEANAAQYRGTMEPVAQYGTRQGTLLVGSAGNSDANLQQGGFFTLPNSLQGLLSVSATGPNDLRTFFSNYGTNEVGVGAPGGGYETREKTLNENPDQVEWPYPLNLVYSAIPGGWGWKAGTSMAAPQVTGLAGLVRELAPEANANQVESAIAQGAEGDQGRGDPDLGAGRISAIGTVQRVQDQGGGQGGGQGGNQGQGGGQNGNQGQGQGNGQGQ